MWERSWYRFEVDLSDEAGGVRRDAQGDELSELPPAEQEINAAADERGALHLAVDTMTDAGRPIRLLASSRDLLRRARAAGGRTVRASSASYYEDDPNVKVIVDRRKQERRDASPGAVSARCATVVAPRDRRLPAAVRRVVKLVVHVDGGARGNPGPAAAAAVVSAPGGEVLDETAVVLGRATNNVAEYRGLLLGLERARSWAPPRSTSSSTPSWSPTRSPVATRSAAPISPRCTSRRRARSPASSAGR